MVGPALLAQERGLALALALALAHSLNMAPLSGNALALLALLPVRVFARSTPLDATEICTRYFGNDAAWYIPRIPLFQSSDAQLNDVYYYRWSIFRAHQRDLGANGYISTEFMDDVSWELFPFASLNDATGFHLGEGRWLRDRRFAHDYVDFMYKLHPETSTYGNDRHFSEAIADASWRVFLVDGDLAAISQHLAAMKLIYEQWYDHFDLSKGLYWIEPLADATEYTISSIDASGGQDGFGGGQSFRPSINSYMYANARAIASIASRAGDPATAELYTARAGWLQGNFTASLWNSTFEHFTDRFQVDNEYVTYWDFIRGRELVGLVPWSFDFVPAAPAPGGPDYSAAWRHALSADELRGEAGLRTVEPSYEYYMRQYRYDSVSRRKECQWNGPIWPFQTTQALGAMSNLLDHYNQSVVTNGDYVDLLRQYAQLHLDAAGVLNLEEDYYPNNGSALVGLARSPHYFHSGYADLILSGLVGIRPRADDSLEVNPLVDGSVSWFRVDNVPYHGHHVSVQWDADGSRFGGPVGLVVEVDGAEVASSPTLARLVATIATAAPPAIARPLSKSVQLQSDSEYPRGSTSVSGADAQQIHDAIDGRIWFWTEVVNGYNSAVGDGNASQWFAVDFGASTEVSRAEIAFYEGDEPGTYAYVDGTYASVTGTYAIPSSYSVQVQDGGGAWTDVATTKADEPLANGITNIEWEPVTTNNTRLMFVPQADKQVRLVEFKVF